MSATKRRRLPLVLLLCVLGIEIAVLAAYGASSRVRIAFWVHWLSSASTESERSYATSKLCSEGDAAVPVLLQGMESETDHDRKYLFLYAIQRVGSPISVEALHGVVESDADEEVRDYALGRLMFFAGNYERPGLALRKVIRKDKSPYLRSVAVFHMRQHYASDEETVQLLRNVAANDSDESVRNYAREMLESLGASGDTPAAVEGVDGVVGPARHGDSE